MDITAWLRGLGLERYAAAFREAEVTPEVLPELREADLRELGLPLGPRKLVLRAVQALTVAAPAGGPVRPERPGQAERRQLTVMFVDLVGSTALSRRLDPEDMRELLRAFQDVVAGSVARFEGHIAKFLGDGVLCYFGWPRAQEDAAERAVRAALGLAAAVSRLTEPGGEPLACRVGIATGPVVVGELIGEGPSAEEAVVGETPNLAARLQALAEPGTVIVAEGTRRLLGNLFAYAEFGPQTLKGFAGPVRAWRVLGEGAAEDRFEALRAAALTPLVGREHELALLYDRWERAREGEGQVVLLSGEPGIGKSRLVRALRERLDGEPHTPLAHFCSPYYANTALYPVIRLLERAAGLRRDDPPAQQIEKLKAKLALAVADFDEAALILADLIGIPAVGFQPLCELSPQQKKQRTFKALLDQLAGLAIRQPVLALYEDAHWADPTTVELIGQVVGTVQHLRVLAVVTFRPGFAPPWAGHGHVTALSLDRLGRRLGAAVVYRVAGGKALPTDILESILDRTDGVPLFVEELTRAVLESGLLNEGCDTERRAGLPPPLAIPSTLQDSLMARLDRLTPLKDVAQIASVIGREFPYDLLEAVAGLPKDELQYALDQLEAAGLVFRRGTDAYLFKHALVRDAAYQSMLKSRRQQLHARLAGALQAQCSDVASTPPELLARHYTAGGVPAQAARYWQRAAELALGRSANQEAVTHCEEAEAQLRALAPSPERTRSRLEVQLVKSFALRASRGYGAPETERAFMDACELCEALGDRVHLVHATRGLWAYYYVAGRWRDATAVAERMRLAAGGLGDRPALCVAAGVRGVTHLFVGEPAAAVTALRQALEHYPDSDRDAHVRLSGHEMGAWIRYHLAFAEWLAGAAEQAAKTSDEAIAIARRGGRPFSIAQTLAGAAVLQVLSRRWQAAGRLANEARELGEHYQMPDWAAYGRMLAGVSAAAEGELGRGTTLVREGATWLRNAGWQCIVPLILSQLAVALRAGSERAAALDTAAEALRMIRTNSELAWEAEALRVLGEVRRAAGPIGAGEADIGAALNVARRQGAKNFELRASISLARMWADDGKAIEARDLLASVCSLFNEGLDTPDRRDASSLLATLVRGHPSG